MNDGEFHITYSYVDTSVYLPGSYFLANGVYITGDVAEPAFYGAP
jgi:hypothetical protein